jgi:hypothetical protein
MIALPLFFERKKKMTNFGLGGLSRLGLGGISQHGFSRRGFGGVLLLAVVLAAGLLASATAGADEWRGRSPVRHLFEFEWRFDPARSLASQARDLSHFRGFSISGTTGEMTRAFFGAVDVPHKTRSVKLAQVALAVGGAALAIVALDNRQDDPPPRSAPAAKAAGQVYILTEEQAVALAADNPELAAMLAAGAQFMSAEEVAAEAERNPEFAERLAAQQVQAQQDGGEVLVAYARILTTSSACTTDATCDESTFEAFDTTMVPVQMPGRDARFIQGSGSNHQLCNADGVNDCRTFPGKDSGTFYYRCENRNSEGECTTGNPQLWFKMNPTTEMVEKWKTIPGARQEACSSGPDCDGGKRTVPINLYAPGIVDFSTDNGGDTPGIARKEFSFTADTCAMFSGGNVVGGLPDGHRCRVKPSSSGGGG